MKLCLIPPIPNLSDFEGTSDHHLLLAQHFGQPGYIDHYRRLANAGDFIIVDNGAHEGRALPFSELLTLAELVHAKEVVIPDVPHSTRASLNLFVETIKWIEGPGAEQYIRCRSPRLMFVPQVIRDPDFTDMYLDTARVMVEFLARDERTLSLDHYTIGVALMYDDLAGGLPGVIDRITWLVEFSGIEIHLLGWARRLHSPIKVAKQFPNVRSIDTCKPFVYARELWHSIDPALFGVPEYPGRPHDYFTTKIEREMLDRAKINVRNFQRAVELKTLPELPKSSSSGLSETRRH